MGSTEELQLFSLPLNIVCMIYEYSYMYIIFQGENYNPHQILKGTCDLKNVNITCLIENILMDVRWQ